MLDTTTDTLKKKKEPKKTELEERLARAAEAKKAILAKFKPKPTVTAENFVSREERRARELQALREKRAAEKEAARIAKLEAEEAQRQALLMDEEHQIALKREERKARKAEAKAAARAKKEEIKQNRGVKKVVNEWDYL